jgi:hypothetical protein
MQFMTDYPLGSRGVEPLTGAVPENDVLDFRHVYRVPHTLAPLDNGEPTEQPARKNYAALLLPLATLYFLGH